MASENNHQVQENNDFNRLQDILKSNKVLLDQMCNRNKITKVIVEAAAKEMLIAHKEFDIHHKNHLQWSNFDIL